MVECGFYVLKNDFFIIVKELGGERDSLAGDRRPVYCCIKDDIVEGLYWAIPTSPLGDKMPHQIQRYKQYMSFPDWDLRSSYYHLAKSNLEAVYNVSACFPFTEKYVSHPFTAEGAHVILRRKRDVAIIEKKLRKILAFELKKNNYFNQRITDIKSYLVRELKIENISTKNSENGLDR